MKTNINPIDLYPHLSPEEVEAINNHTVDFDSLYTESDVLNFKKLNDDANLLSPILSSGWPQSDIDAINEVSDIRLQNVLIARLQPLGNNPENNLSDDELIDTVIRRNLTSSEVDVYASEYKWLSEESARIANEIIDKRSTEQINSPSNE